MKTQPTVAHGFKTHTIACVFHDFEGFQEMTKILKQTAYYSISQGCISEYVLI